MPETTHPRVGQHIPGQATHYPWDLHCALGRNVATYGVWYSIWICEIVGQLSGGELVGN